MDCSSFGFVIVWRTYRPKRRSTPSFQRTPVQDTASWVRRRWCNHLVHGPKIDSIADQHSRAGPVLAIRSFLQSPLRSSIATPGSADAAPADSCRVRRRNFSIRTIPISILPADPEPNNQSGCRLGHHGTRALRRSAAPPNRTTRAARWRGRGRATARPLALAR